MLSGSNFAPQFVQNSGAFLAPHFAQKRLPLRNGAPHCLQNAVVPAALSIFAPIFPAAFAPAEVAVCAKRSGFEGAVGESFCTKRSGFRGAAAGGAVFTTRSGLGVAAAD